MISKVSTFLGPSSIFGSGVITLPNLVLYLDAGNTYSYPGTGTNWYDLSTYHNNGVFNINPTYSNVWGGSVGFTGSSNYVSFSGLTAIPIGDSQYTIETWVQSNNLSNSDLGGIIGWGTYGEDYTVNVLRYEGNGVKNYWWGYDLATPNLGMTTSLYYHVVAKYDGSNRQIWVNGTMSASDVPGITHSVDTFTNLTVGKSWTSGNEYLDGSISYLKLYNKSLSDSQIITNFNTTKSRFGYSYGSFLFDGTNQYLSNTSIDYSFGTGDFTMEAFFNHSISGVSYNGILSLRDNDTGGGVDINLQNSDSTPYIEFFANGVANLFTASNDTWYHVAMSRVSGTTSFYVNGNLFTQIEDTTLYTQTNLVIGRSYNDYDGFYYNGIISNVRVINGTGIYTSSFTPPTTPLGTTASTRLLLLSQENMLVSDSSGNNEIVVNHGGVGWTSSVPKFYVDNGLQFYVDGGMMSSYPGSGSVWYDISGNGRNLTLDPGVTFNPSLGGWLSFDGSSIAQSLTYSISLSSGFTVEVIFKSNNGSGIFKFNNPGANDYINIQSYGSYFRWEVDQGSSMNSTGGISNNTWLHVACTFNGSSGKIYINGSLNSTSSLSQTRTGSQTSPFVLGLHDYFLNGGIGMARFYNRPLTQEEISSNFNNSKTRFGL